MVRREYFVENQLDAVNVHDHLEPEESTRFIRGHVLDGLRVADEYRLPEAIKEFIREHHGTSLMVYFYSNALANKAEGTVSEADYRYPGPKPQSRETGILMLADASEAVTRTLDNPNPNEIVESLRTIVINKYMDGELDECPLTLHDLSGIIDAFLPILEGMHHHRIKYPSRESTLRKIVENGDAVNDKEESS